MLGRSEQARRAVITHTASLTADAAVGAEFLRRTGISPPDVAMAAIAAAARVGQAWAGPAAPPVAGPDGTGQRRSAVGHTTRRGGGQAAAPRPRRAGARRRGLCEPRRRGRRGGRAAGPVALKGVGVAHKTEQHAVLLDPADVGAAAAELLARFPAVLVERLVADGVAELLVGVHTDAVFGRVLTLGTGGVLTELVRDVAQVLLPADARDIRRALLGLRCAPLLTGCRGAPAADVDELVAVVERVVELVLGTPEVVTLEINPLIVTATGAWACDALLVTSGDAP